MATSETRVIKRLQIQLNKQNPKRHKEDRIKIQEKNLKKVGYLGGIVWNETTGRLIDGHRRILAMDLFYGFDGTAATDYAVKVEVVHMSEKEERQQLAYMAAGDTLADIDLLADFVDDVDFGEIGLSDNEINDILSFANGGESETKDIFYDLVKPTKEVPVKGTQEYEQDKERVKAGKERTREMANEAQRNEMAYVTLSFDNYSNLTAFCELLGVESGARYVKGEEVLALIS